MEISTTVLSVRAFGIVREIVNGREVKVSVADPTVGSLRQALYAGYPRLVSLRSLMIAVNNEYASDEQVLRPGDEVALIPPVSGG